MDDDLEAPVARSLYLEDIDANLFRARQEQLWKPVTSRAVFGGNIIGQALVAAQKTVEDQFHLHSMHASFLRPGQLQDVLYQVERVRDGRSFVTRVVRAIQGGEIILQATVNFHVSEQGAFEHQYPMPKAPDPETLPNQRELYARYLADHRMPDKFKHVLKSRMAQEIPIDIRPCSEVDVFERKPESPHELVWMRAHGRLGDEPSLHRCAAAYMSDHSLLWTALRPHPQARVRMIASLDHSMWFHTQFRADEWMLYEMESPRANGNRAFTLGRLYTRDGTLAISVAQEGVVRCAPPKEEEEEEDGRHPTHPSKL